jgi:hypothetical protein
MLAACSKGPAPSIVLKTTLSIVAVVGSLRPPFSEVTVAQGETTSAISGQVSDTSEAAVPGATVTVTNHWRARISSPIL